MDLKTIPEKLFVRKIDTEKTRWPENSTFSIFFNFKNKRYLVKDYRQMVKYEYLEKCLLEEEEIPNIPVSGFVIIWPNMVQDPRGFSAMVSNLSEIVSNSVINRGVIDGDLWYAISPDNRLSLVSSETEKYIKSAISSVSELKIGNIVESGYSVNHGIYLGKIKVRERNWKSYCDKNPILTTRRVTYCVETDSFDTLGVYAGIAVTGTADPDTVLEVTNKFKSRLEAYTCLEDNIDSIFAPDGSEKEPPSEMIDILLSASNDERSNVRYPFYKIIGPKKILLLDLYPNNSYRIDPEKVKDGVYFQVREEELTLFGTFTISYGNAEKVEKKIKEYSGSWKELLKDQGWIYFGLDNFQHWKSYPNLMVKMKSGKTLTI